ncbi:MAG TPA: GPP34 family phosphoprotein [Prolixibacteraceae bacterium]|jgi:hypothetical protein
MRQDLKLSEKLFCLSVNPTKGGIFFNASSNLNMTLVGLILVELVNKGLISIENEVVHLVNPALQNDEIYEFVLKPIRLREKDRKIRTWISWFDFWGRKIKKLIMHSLVKKYILRIEEKRFLFFPYDKVFLMDRDLVESIRQELESVWLGSAEPNEQSIILAQMAAQNHLLARIFPDRDKRKEAARRLKEFPQSPITKAVLQAIFIRNAGRAASH